MCINKKEQKLLPYKDIPTYNGNVLVVKLNIVSDHW